MTCTGSLQGVNTGPWGGKARAVLCQPARPRSPSDCQGDLPCVESMRGDSQRLLYESQGATQLQCCHGDTVIGPSLSFPIAKQRWVTYQAPSISSRQKVNRKRTGGPVADISVRVRPHDRPFDIQRPSENLAGDEDGYFGIVTGQANFGHGGVAPESKKMHQNSIRVLGGWFSQHQARRPGPDVRGRPRRRELLRRTTLQRWPLRLAKSPVAREIKVLRQRPHTEGICLA